MPHRRTAWGKFREMALALRIEWSLTKREILEQYLNRVTFGPGLRGIEAASRFYFDKPTRELSLAEVALLAGMPRGPLSTIRARGPRASQRSRDRMLARMRRAGIASTRRDRTRRGRTDCARQGAGGLGAPHFVRALLQGAIDPSVASTDHVPRGDRDHPRRPPPDERSRFSRRHGEALVARHVTAASVVVLDNATGDILAYVGSPDFDDAERLGENDGVLARRQPGSALKPFVYELALEKLAFTARDRAARRRSASRARRRRLSPPELRRALPRARPAARGARQLLQRARGVHRVGCSARARCSRGCSSSVLLRSIATPALWRRRSRWATVRCALIELANAYATLARGGVLPPGACGAQMLPRLERRRR